MSKKCLVLFLILIIILGSFFRLYKISQIPPGLWPDEAINANEALEKPGKVFYPENNGREGLYINLLWLSFKIFGIKISTIRLTSAIIGILTLIFFYFFALEISKYLNLKKEKEIALFSTFFLATSFWHTLFSRIGFRGILLPFEIVTTFYFLLSGFNKKSLWRLILGGVFFGLGFYTYSSFRLIPLVVFVLFLVCLLKYGVKITIKNFVILGIVAFIVALPLLFYFLNHPDQFFGRLNQISIFSSQNPIKAFFVSLSKHLLMFNFKGDPNWRHNIANYPQLNLLVGFFFLVGIFWLCGWTIKSTKQKNWKNLSMFAFLFALFFIPLLGGALTIEGIPHSLRAIGTIPAVYLFAGIGIIKLEEFLSKSKYFAKAWLYLLIIILPLIAAVEFHKYFIVWGQNENVKGAFCESFVKMGEYLNSFGDDTKLYVIANEPGVPVPWPDGISVMAQTLMFVEREKYHTPRAIYLKPNDLNKIQPSNRTIILLMRNDPELFEKLQKKYPQGKINLNPPIFSFEIL